MSLTPEQIEQEAEKYVESLYLSDSDEMRERYHGYIAAATKYLTQLAEAQKEIERLKEENDRLKLRIYKEQHNL